MYKMELKGIDKQILQKLKESELTLENIAVSTSEELIRKVEISKKDAKKVIEAAQNELGIQPVTALQFL
ncbi:MAG: hypothetical protein E3J43_03300, partial [Candidatus Heimdallarchaeota archaeon]